MVCRTTAHGDCSHTEGTKLRPLQALSSGKVQSKGSGSIPLLATHPYLLAARCSGYWGQAARIF